MKVLIVGANSFLASKFIKKLNPEFELFGLINFSIDKVDFTKYKKIFNSSDSLFNEINEFDEIYIFASYRPLGKINSPSEKYTKNIKLVADISLKYKKSKLILFSSISVYGNCKDEIITTKSNFSNPNLYGLSKIAVESIVINHQKYLILRPSTIWGKEITENSFLPRLISQAKNDEFITLYGDGSRKQNFIHYTDVIKMTIELVKKNDNKIVNIVSRKSISNLSIAEKVASHFNKKIIHQFEDLNPSQEFDYNETFDTIGFYPEKGLLENINELY